MKCDGCGKEIEGKAPVYCHTVYELFDWRDGWWRGEENQEFKEKWYCDVCEEKHGKD